MPIVFEEVSAEITPPVPTSSSTEGRSEGAPGSKVDAHSMLRELQRVAERAERLRAD